MRILHVLPAMARGPQAVLLAASAVGWSAVLVFEHALVAPDFCGSYAGAFADWSTGRWEAAFAANPPSGLLLPWLAMTLAMMPPLLGDATGHLWARSLRRRRIRALAGFALAYGAVWVVAGAGLTLLALGLALGAKTGGAWAPLAGALAVAGLWQCTPAKQTALNRCHQLPRLCAFGLQADLDCLRFGARSGMWCVASCWALMLVPLTVGRGHPIAMAAISVILLHERLGTPRPARWRLIA